MNSNLETRNYKLKTRAGFSIIELLVVSAIISTFSVVLILNFRFSPVSKTAREQTARVVISDIRRMQANALSGSRYQGDITCGYGIHYISTDSYILYTKPVPGGSSCAFLSTKNYQSANDLTVETKMLANSKMELRSSFSDIFFEPPDPKTYINNNASLTAPNTTITVQLKGQSSCAQSVCTNINVYTSGRIDLTN